MCDLRVGMAAHGVEASNPLSITGVIMIPISGKHCIVCVPHSCSDFLVVSMSGARFSRLAGYRHPAKCPLGDPGFRSSLTVGPPLFISIRSIKHIGCALAGQQAMPPCEIFSG